MNMPDGLPVPRRYWSILTLAMGIAASVLDATTASVALPTIGRDLGVDAAESIWVVNAYQVAVTISLLPFASLGDIYGYRHVFRAGVVAFFGGALACAFAGSFEVLVAARVVEGFGASAMMSVNTALVRFTYPRAMLGRAIGTTAMVVAVFSAIGPTVAATVLSVASWRWLFVVTLPISVVVFALSWNTLPVTPRSRHPFDAASAALSAGTFGLLIAGIDGAGHGGSWYVAVAELAGAVLFGWLLVRRQAHLALPLFPVDLFRRIDFSLTVATSVCSFAAQTLAFVAIPFYFQAVLGRSQVETGFLMTPWPATVALLAPIAGRLADKVAVGVLATTGMLTMCTGLVALALLPEDAAAVDIVWRLSLAGLGFGLFQTPNNRALVGSAPPERSGSIGGVQSSARLLGQTCGAAMVGLVFTLVASPGALGRAPVAAIMAGAGFAGAAALASGLRLRGGGARRIATMP